MKMKTYFKSILVAFLLVMFTVSCNDYLDVPVESNVTEEDVYSTYKGYQGFVDYMYTLIIDYNRHALTTTGNIGGEVIGSGTMGWTSGYKAMRGTYQEWIGNQLHSNYNASAENNAITGSAPTGEWPDSWKGIRAANKALPTSICYKAPKKKKISFLVRHIFSGLISILRLFKPGAECLI
jgi:starch-binding outer membrane protein, SusD/RagB family